MGRVSGGVLLGEGENSGVLCPQFSRLRFAVVVVDVLLVVSFVSVGRVVVKLICEQVRAFEPPMDRFHTGAPTAQA